MAQVSQTDVYTDLTYLVGNDTIPSPVPTNWSTFVQRSLERISRYVDFNFGKTIATISLTSGVGSLPTNARQDPNLDVRVINSGQGDDHVFKQVSYEESDNYSVGDYRYWVTTNQAGTQSLYTTETTTSSVVVRYSLVAPTINASVMTNFPSSMVIAEGALIYVRRAEDKDADTAQEEAIFQNELEEVISAMNRNSGPKRATTRQDISGRQTGELSGGSDYRFESLRS